MRIDRKCALLAASALSFSYAAPVWAQDEAADEGSSSDIIVTAQRVEQRLQDVPIAITVFDQEKLANNNILSAKDIATYTPGVYAQTRFGNDVTTYTIRGFAQEQRTTATVGTYFAEVVAPRGNGVSQGGDGASPGALFDLQNVQVLKGPQGTLFGRNTTGGAVLLVPAKPKDKFEGFIEGTYGDLDRRRIQGVINVPLGETLRARFGVDRHLRDGYIKNVGVKPRHDRDMGSIDILALRGSLVWDVTPDIENYLIVSYSESKGTGSIPVIGRVFANRAEIGCVEPTVPAAAQAGLCPVVNAAGNLAFTAQATEQFNRERAAGGFWTGTNSNPDAEAYFEELRIINRTEFKISDSVSLTNLFGYSTLKGNNAVDAFGLNSLVNPAAPGAQGSYFSFVPITANPDLGLTADQKAIVEELRLTGQTDKLSWQAGLYYEKSSPRSFTGTFSPTATICTDISTFSCAQTTPLASIPPRTPTSGTLQYNKVWNTTLAAYAQATYNFTEQLALTGGIRWTEDKTRARFANGRVIFAPNPLGNATRYTCGFPLHPDAPSPNNFQGDFANTLENRLSRCFFNAETKTSAPTWLIGLDYKPNEDILLYAKWSRGYRQGGLVPPTGLIDFVEYPEERVDAYEIGAKTSWGGAVRGTFNVSAYLNKFKGQQIQAGINNANNSIQTTMIVPGDSELYGLEIDAMVEPAEWLKLEAAYAYNHTELQRINYPDLSAFGLVVRQLPVGGPLPLAVPHAFNGTATVKLPMPESLGDISLSGTIVHQSSFRAVADAITGTNFGVLPKRTFGNVNVNWKDVGGMPVDLAFYVTNVTNEKMVTHINEQSTRGFLAYSVDEPRQWGVRLKYRFGD